LTIFVVGGVLKQRLTDTLAQPTVHLPSDNHRVDDVAEVIDNTERLPADAGRFPF